MVNDMAHQGAARLGGHPDQLLDGLLGLVTGVPFIRQQIELALYQFCLSPMLLKEPHAGLVLAQLEFHHCNQEYTNQFVPPAGPIQQVQLPHQVQGSRYTFVDGIHHLALDQTEPEYTGDLPKGQAQVET